jgi:hypothetical protein
MLMCETEYDKGLKPVEAMTRMTTKKPLVPGEPKPAANQ